MLFKKRSHNETLRSVQGRGRIFDETSYDTFRITI